MYTKDTYFMNIIDPGVFNVYSTERTSVRMDLVRASDRAYASLREDIIGWALAPGTVLGEVEQAERLGVSRTPLREALARLTADGLARPYRGRGVVVTEVSEDEVAQLFELRHALECKAATLAALRGDPALFGSLTEEFLGAASMLEDDPKGERYYALVHRFDQAIDEAMGNPHLLQALKGLRLHLVRLRRLAKDDLHRLLASAHEHATIADAIACGDTELASAATAVHLHKSLRYLSRKMAAKKSN
jgi:GntR family transcriptional regulator, rspAB operon transcriptional repressor